MAAKLSLSHAAVRKTLGVHFWLHNLWVSPYCRPHRLLAAKLGWCAPPNFIVIGTQRGGTTSLYNYLLQHPDCRGALSKEVHFFDLNYAKGLTWYLAHFPPRRAADPAFITGEASPYYLFHPQTPPRVAQTLPHVKLIALLRNPIERAYSHYQFKVSQGYEHLPFEEALTLDPAWKLKDQFESDAINWAEYRHYSYLARGIYINQLQRWLAHVAPDRLLILKSEEFFREPARVFSHILDFLGLAHWQPPHFQPYNVGSYAELSDTVRNRLHQFFHPYNERLAHWLNMDLGEWA
jgi:hypothetical protein